MCVLIRYCISGIIVAYHIVCHPNVTDIILYTMFHKILFICLAHCKLAQLIRMFIKITVLQEMPLRLFIFYFR